MKGTIFTRPIGSFITKGVFIFYKQFTSESVCAGHPDKICDQISDAILDAALAQDPYSRVAVETAVKDRVILLGELTTNAKLDYEEIVRAEIKRLGYTNPAWGFHEGSPVEVRVNHQSGEIAQGVDNDGAGDQGMMFGFACRESEQLMPLPISLAHALTRRVDEVRENKILNYLRPDGKAQVTIGYESGVPVRLDKVVVAVAHDEAVTHDQIKADIFETVVSKCAGDYGLAIDPKNIIVNGTGVWHIPGPINDAGLTGRKIIVDSYGGYARVGGGAFSGKDPSKVDRSGAYAARFIAKNIVAAGLAESVEVALAYCIGVKNPIMQAIDTFGTATTNIHEINEFANSLLDTSVRGIINKLELRRPIYRNTAAYGHFGNPEYSWEKISPEAKKPM